MTSIEWGFVIGTWLIIVLLFMKIWMQQDEKVPLWRAIVVCLVGLFTLSINLPLFEEYREIAILPLGVWVIVFLLRNKETRWAAYRKFAWLGFLSNYIFLLIFIIETLLYRALYPADELATYVQSLEHAEVFVIHESVEEKVLASNALENLQHASKAAYNAFDWHETAIFSESEERFEQFPYILTDIEPKNSFPYQFSIYIERDGNGILLTSEKVQYYFRTAKPVLQEVNE